MAKAKKAEVKTYERADTRLAIGGLMRCCTGSLGDWIRSSDKPIKVGEVVFCKYEAANPTSMILGEDGVWRWNHP